ncbi:MAG: type II toxin-antitoxin system VapC family toxin [Coriobacteriales bacterium]|jgi:PIN domain nuclease of toxin-antitoxin system|nr:type II toxin-antitoxin system VapC family toxin [Coriobacteriales bacterium]
MKYLVDTHILLWFYIEPERLDATVQKILCDDFNTVYYSPVSLWEISIKYGLGKLDLGNLKPETLLEEIEAGSYTRLTLNDATVVTSYNLPCHHRDPFDRLLIWQAIENNLVLLTVDENAKKYKEEGLHVLP